MQSRSRKLLLGTTNIGEGKKIISFIAFSVQHKQKMQQFKLYITKVWEELVLSVDEDFKVVVCYVV